MQPPAVISRLRSLGRWAEFLLLSSLLTAGRLDAAAVAAPLVLYPSLAVTNDDGSRLPLFSVSACGAEFRHLRRTLHTTDLAGAAIQTDGWTRNIAEAEWPWMTCAYFGYACGDLAQLDPARRTEALAEMRWLLEAMLTPRLSGFVTPHFGEPFGTNRFSAAVFVHGHFLQLAVRYREISSDQRFDPLIRRVAEGLSEAYLASDSGVLKSYPNMWWISDNLPALSGLARYDRLFQRDTSAAREKFLRQARQHYLDPATGLLGTYVDASGKVILQGARGISTMYGLHFLRDVAPDFAVKQYALARQHFIREALGFAAVREFATGSAGQSDIDSGPVILGFGPSASGFAIAAAALMDDGPTAGALLKASAWAGLPVLRNGELSYAAMPPVGQAVILFGKTSALRQPAGGRH